MANILGRARLQDAGKGYTLRLTLQHWVCYNIMITWGVSSTKYLENQRPQGNLDKTKQRWLV